MHVKEYLGGGSWLAQLVKQLDLGFSTCHDLTGCGTEPCVRDLLQILSPFLSLSVPPHSCVYSLCPK